MDNYGENMLHHWPTPSFYTNYDPTLLPPGTSQARIDLEHRKRCDTEKLPDFKPAQIGCFSAKWQSSYDATKRMGMWLPKTQCGFPNLNKRWRERQNTYTAFKQQQAIFNGRVQKKQPRHLFVRRRSNKMKKIPLPSWAVDAEKNLESGYQKAAIKKLRNCGLMKKIFGQPKNEKELLQFLLTPIILDSARKKALLEYLDGYARITVLANNKFQLEIPRLQESPVTLNCLNTAVGEWAEVKSTRGPAEKCCLIVHGTANNKLELKLGVRGTALPLFLQGGINSVRDCKVTFVAADVPQRMQMASTIDLLTAMGDRFLNVTPTTSTARTPLITDDQMHRLGQGLGFYNKGLDREQQRAVFQLLSNANDQGLFILLGPGGSGKTIVITEATVEINKHHRERLPCDASVYICEPTNSNCRKLVMQLVKSGIDPAQIVWVISDQESNRDTSGLPVTATRVSEYELMDYHQVYVGTHTALGKLCMSLGNLTIPPPLVMMVDEAPSSTLGLTAVPLTQNGEPVLVVLAGDPMQLEAISLSRVSNRLFGRESIFYVLKLFSAGLFEDLRDESLTPKASVGVRLRANYRAVPYLTEFLSSVFYNNSIYHAGTRDDNYNKDLYAILNEEELTNETIRCPMLWYPHSTAVVRNPLTLSLENDGEANFVFKVLKSWIDVLGECEILLTSPYKSQVNKYKTQFRGFPALLVGSIEEMQGQERNVVFVSLVRSKIGEEDLCSTTPLGFLTDPKRINVVASRGRRIVVFVGCREHFWYNQTEEWGKVIQACQVVTHRPKPETT